MATQEYKLELVLLPVTDIDRAKTFYADQVGFPVKVDHVGGPDFRIVQLDPPGSSCSIAFGLGITSASPGSVIGLHLMVNDIEAARAELAGRGVEVTPVRHMTGQGWRDGVDPAHADYNSFADFADPDGNTWVLQERDFAS